MKNVATLIFFLINGTVSFSQLVWQNPNITGEHLNDIHFQSTNVGWVVGDVGTLLKTTDSGNSWVKQDIGSCADLSNIQFVDSNEGWAIGSGTLFHTTNGGSNWSPFSVMSYSTISALWFISPSIGWVRCEAGLLATIDGGNTWELKNASINSTFCFANPRKGWQATPFGGVKYTTDGGATWTTQTTGVSENILSISIIDSNEVWMAGVSGLIHTTNAGTNWTVNLPSRTAIGATLIFLTDCHFVNQNIGWAISPNYQALIITSDGGLTWTKKDVVGGYGVYGFDGLNGIVIGDALYETTDGGNTITNKLSSVTNNDLYAVSFPDNSNGWTVGTVGSVLRTTNGGAEWIPQSAGTTSDLNSIFALNTNEAWIAGNTPDTILHTVNGGATWLTQTSGTNQYLYDIYFTDSQNGWTVGDAGVVSHTTDGGQNWTLQNSSVNSKLNTVYFINSSSGWIGGENGLILYTSNGGDTWTAQNSGTTNAVKDVHFVSLSDGWAVGDAAMVLHTSDGGNTWDEQVLNLIGDLFPLNAVFFKDSNVGWATGFAPSIFQTSDGGTTWNPISCAPLNRHIYSLSFPDDSHGWVVGERGAILFANTINDDLSISENDQNRDGLIRFFPNPISDFVTIQLNLEQSVDVKQANYSVQLLDVSGRLAFSSDFTDPSMVINVEKLKAGIYYVALLKDETIVNIEKMVKGE